MKQLSLPTCLASVLDYLSAKAVVTEADENGRPGPGISLDQLAENSFYIFDGESAMALEHAIKDLALEQANGELLAGCQDYADWESQQERYAQLGATIHRVQVVANGRLPVRLTHVQLLRDRAAQCRNYRLVAYEGRPLRALFLAQQIAEAKDMEERQFLGFYTLNARLIARLRKDFLELADGRTRILREYARQAALDQAAKQFRREFSLQEQFLGAAMRRLQLDGERYCAGEFAHDLEKGLAQLCQWKTRMPEILARVASH